MKDTAIHLRETVKQVVPLLKAISDKKAGIKPSPAKWSKKEILGHLIDSACNNQQKFVRMMVQPHLDFVGYAQNHWVEAQHYQKAKWRNIVDLWANYNFHIAHIIENAEADCLDNTITINGVGCFKLGFIMADYAEHLKHHLKQVIPDAGLESTFENVYNA